MRKLKRILIAGATLVSMVLVPAGCNKSTTNQSESYINLAEYYKVEKEGNYTIVADGLDIGEAITVNGKIYLPQDMVVKYINSQFYYDKENKEIRYCTPTEIKTVKADAGEQVITKDQKIYLSYDYVAQNSHVSMSLEKEPDRVVVFTEIDDIKTCTVTKETKLYLNGQENSEALLKLNKGDVLYKYNTVFLYGNTVETENSKRNDELDIPKGYIYAMTKDGVLGYVRESDVETSQNIVLQPNNKQPEYTYITMDEKVCLGWHQMTNTTGNADLGEKIKDATALNVVSPTWFSVTDTDGSISSLAQKSYVTKAKNSGLSVWALINDFEKDENDKHYISSVLKTTETRSNLIKNIMNEIKEYSIDGINIDFENIAAENAYDYIQFIRELSVECRNSGTVLSVDLYVPMSYNQYYGRSDIGKVVDYVIVMGYDEHWGGGNEAGSVASIKYVQNGINNTKKCVASERIINAIPFYSRIWEESKTDNGGVYVEDAVNGDYYLASSAKGMDSCAKEVKSWGVEKVWLEEIGQYYAEYTQDDVLKRIWMEDEKSIELKLEKIKEADIAGVACWKLGFENENVWSLIENYMN